MNLRALHPILEEDFRTVLASALPWHRLSGKTVLITGATGLVASYLVEVVLFRNEIFKDEPCTVVALARDEQRAEHRFAHHASRSDLRLLIQDVAAPLPSSLDASYVVHAAGNATPKAFGADPVGTYRAAVLGTH